MNDSKLWQSQHFINHQTSNDKKNQKLKQKSNPKDNKKHFRGDLWDRISLREMLAVKNKKLYQGQSKYQNIQVLEASDIRMFLDEQLQFSSLDERIYHEAFVHVPMALTKSHDNILILGGGDGLALREVLKYSDVKHVDLVDIDSEILKIASQVPEIVALNERSLFDKRVNVYAKDARKFLKKNKKTYDLMIIDFPDPADDFLASLYSLEMFQMVRNHLSKNGMIVCQSNSPFDTPVVYWSIGLTLEKTGFYTESYHTVIPSFGDWGFHLASNKPFPSKLKTVPVPCRTLPKNLASLFHFQSNTLSHQRSAIVNALDNLQLHEIYKREIV